MKQKKLILGFILIAVCLISLPNVLSIFWFGGKAPVVNSTVIVTNGSTFITAPYIMSLGFRFFGGDYLYTNSTHGLFNESKLNDTIYSIISYINLTNGTNGINGTNGVDGVNGTNGVDGVNGTNAVDNGSYVPYIGANKSVNLGIYNLTADTFFGNLFAQNITFGTLNSARLNGVYSNVTGLGNQTQNLNMGNKNITNVSCIVFYDGGTMCSTP